MYVQPAKLLCRNGPDIMVHYSDFTSGGSFGLYMPVTFINTSTRIGTVLDAAISIYKIEKPDEIFYIRWRDFIKIDTDKKKFVTEELSHALVIPGKSSVYKTVWFLWNSDNPQKFLLEKGSYIMKFYYWSDNKKYPNCEVNKFVVTDELYKKVEMFRQEESQGSVKIRLNNEIADNKLMTKYEVIQLLGK